MKKCEYCGTWFPSVRKYAAHNCDKIEQVHVRVQEHRKKNNVMQDRAAVALPLCAECGGSTRELYMGFQKIRVFVCNNCGMPYRDKNGGGSNE